MTCRGPLCRSATQLPRVPHSEGHAAPRAPGLFRGITVAIARPRKAMMPQRSPRSRPQPTGRHQRGGVPLKAMLPLMVLGLARASTLVAGTETRARQDSPGAFASADTRGAVPARSDQPCFPVSVEVRTEEHDGSVTTGWASVDRTAHFEGRTCQVKGWATINSCGRTITAYLANCPDGAFTFTKTAADCYYVLGCSDRQDGAATAAPR